MSKAAKRGDIYVITMEPVVADMQPDARTVLVVSPDRFNEVMRVLVVVPITCAGEDAPGRGFAVSLARAGTRTTGTIRCDQPRSVDLAARDGRRLESIPAEILEDVLARLVTLFQ